MKNSRKNSVVKRSASSQARKAELPEVPPPLQTTMTVGHVFRFQASAALSDVAVSRTSISNILNVATAATTSTRLVAAWRIKRVLMWGPMASDLVPVTASVEYPIVSGGFSNAPKLHSDTSMGSVRAARVDSKPPPGSVASMWNSGSSTDTLFSLNGPDNTVVDLHLTFVLLNGETPVAGNTLTGATAGEVTAGRLDGAGGNLLPVSYLSRSA
jgi:hypothetical protein